MSALPHNRKIRTSRRIPPWQVEWHASLDSTMTLACERAASGAPDGTVVVADYQHSGRGTHGRTWVAPAGTCLMFSFVLRPGPGLGDLAPFPAITAGLIRDVLNETYGACTRVELPNDIIAEGGKLAGILCQSRIRAGQLEWLVCGVGLNTNLTMRARTIASTTSLLIETGQCVCHARLLEQLLVALEPLRDAGNGTDALAQSAE